MEIHCWFHLPRQTAEETSTSKSQQVTSSSLVMLHSNLRRKVGVMYNMYISEGGMKNGMSACVSIILLQFRKWFEFQTEWSQIVSRTIHSVCTRGSKTSVDLKEFTNENYWSDGTVLRVNIWWPQKSTACRVKYKISQRLRSWREQNGVLLFYQFAVKYYI